MSRTSHDASRDTVGELLLMSSLLVLYVGLRGTARALGAAQTLVADGDGARP
jgi:hypothetical protein